MCDGVSEVAAVMAVVGAVAGYMGQQQQASDINRQYRDNRAAALIAYQDDNEASSLDAMTAQEDNAIAAVRARREGLVARAQVTADGEDRGVGGLGVHAIRQAVSFQAGENASTLARNADFDSQRARLGMKASYGTANARISGASTARGPSLLALGAQLGSAAVSSYQMHSTIKANNAQVNFTRRAP